MKRRLGRQEMQALAWLQMYAKRSVRTGELCGPLGLTPAQERELFGRLARGGVTARVRRGLYLVPDKLPLGGTWSPGEALAINTLMEDRGGRYQICGPNAFNRYGLSDQIPVRVCAYNNRISGDRTVGAVKLTLIKVADGRLGATDAKQTFEGEALYSSRARTLVDAVYDWARFGSLPQGFEWIRTELATGPVRAAELVRVVLRYGDIGTIRRVGALLEGEAVGPRLLVKLERALSRTSALVPWDPTRPKRGTVDRRWGVVWNERI